MAVTMWFQQRVDGDHIVVSGEKIWQLQCGLSREWMVVSRENRWPSQCGFNREWMAITVWSQERTDNHLYVIPTEHRLLLHFDISRQQFREYMK